MLTREQNPTDNEKKSLKDASQIYNDEQREYLSFLQTRLEDSYREHNKEIKHYKNRTRREYYEDSEKLSNTWLPEKQNDDDVIISAGTIESKLDDLLSNINNLNLSPQIFALDEENNLLDKMSKAIEDIVEETEKYDGGVESGDKEKKQLRQRDLMKYGTVFVQEEWLKKYETKKVLKDKNYKGQFEGVEWEEKLVKVFEGPSRELLPGLNVFYGDLNTFHTEDQPFIYFIKKMNYSQAKARFGKFDNWKYVKKGRLSATVADNDRSIFGNQWRITKELDDDEVEVVYYQDAGRDEFQMVVNGVLMLPVGFPLSAVSPGGRYNIAKQVFRILNSSFPYGGAFVQKGSVKEQSRIIDEMLKLMVLKTRKSFTPPYANISGRVISKKVLSPGRISMIDPNVLKPIGQESQGVTSGEVAVFTEMQNLLDRNTVAPILSGQSSQGDQTATEVLQLQRQAQLTLGLTIAAMSLLETKLTYLRIYNIMQNWFDPIKETVTQQIDGSREYVKQYRSVRKNTSIEGIGSGQRRIMVQENIPQGIEGSREIRRMEREEEKKIGKPVELVMMDPEIVKGIRATWYVEVLPKENNSSALRKLMFREMIADTISLANLGAQLNVAGLQEEFGKIWNMDTKKVFNDQVTVENAEQLAAGGGKVNTVTANQIGPDQQPGRSGGSAIPSGAVGGSAAIA